jgi:hypothetical protein
MRTVVLAVTGLLISATAAASPPGATPLSTREPEVTSYRAQTLIVDGLGIALLVAGGLSEGENGRDTRASGTLFTAGALTITLGSPVVHALNGNRSRGAGSFGMRLGLAGLGAMIAIAGRSRCDDGQPPPQGEIFDDDFLCELDYLGYGVLGGFIVASLLDAAFMTDKPVQGPPRWSPRMTASRDGVHVGAAWRW